MTNSIDSVAGVDDFATMVKDLMAERDKLQADLAAARALLREANKWIGRDCTSVREQIAELAPLCNRIDAALAGKAEP